MGAIEQILENQAAILEKLAAIERMHNPAIDTSMIDVPTMAKELKVTESGFRNRYLSTLVKKGIVIKIGGRYKAQRCNFEAFKREG